MNQCSRRRFDAIFELAQKPPTVEPRFDHGEEFDDDASRSLDKAATAPDCSCVQGHGSPTTKVAALRLGADHLIRVKRRAIATRVTASFGLDALSATTKTERDGQFVSGLFQIQAVEYLPWYDMRLQSRLDELFSVVEFDESFDPLEFRRAARRLVDAL